MRVLFVSAPLLGHVFPLVPLLAAFRAAGHDVLVATAGAATKVGTPEVPVRDVAPGFKFGRTATLALLPHPIVLRREVAGTAGTRGVAVLFDAVNGKLLAGLSALVAEWRPDLVVHEPLAAAGAVAAARAGIPAVLQENSLFDGPTLVRVTNREPIPPAAATISIAPPSVLPERPGWPMHAVPYSGPITLPDWLAEPGPKPRIAVSHSTVPGPGQGLMRKVAAVAGRLDAEVVLIRPDKRVGALPPNVKAVDWVSIPALLPTCAAIVHHGGAGTALAALDAGVPQLIVNGAGDRRHNGSLIANRGAGLAADERALGADLLARLIDDDRLAAAAREVSAEMRAMPAPAELVPRLAALPPGRR